MREAIRNHNELKGFSLLGAALSAQAMILFLHGYFEMADWISLAFAFPATVYWIFVSLAVFKNKLSDKNENNKSSRTGTHTCCKSIK